MKMASKKEKGEAALAGPGLRPVPKDADKKSGTPLPKKKSMMMKPKSR